MNKTSILLNFIIYFLLQINILIIKEKYVIPSSFVKSVFGI